MRNALALSLLAVAVLVSAVSAQQNPFLGSWNMTGTGNDTSFVYWLKVEPGADGVLTGRFLNRTGSPVTLGMVKIEGDELVFQMGRPDNLTGSVFRAKVENGRLIGRHTVRQGGRRGGSEPATEREVSWIGVRTPTWPAADANASHKFGTPVVLFDTTKPSMDAWGVQFSDRPVNWAIVEGLLQNTPPANNLVSKQKFGDFKLEAEYKLSPKSNAGLYLRGRYEMQVLDDAGQPTALTGHMSIYGRKAPDVNASLPAGEWQRTEIVLVGNRVTITLNGKRVHDNAVIEGITGGALDNDELTPGPIMIQGDHTLAQFRKVVVTPIVR